MDDARNHLTQLPVKDPQLWCSSWRESEDGLATAVVTATAVVHRRDEVAACVGWFRALLQLHVKPWDLRHPGHAHQTLGVPAQTQTHYPDHQYKLIWKAHPSG